MSLDFARGVSFDEARHEYRYRGRQLSGITGLISKKLGLKMPEEFVEEHRMEGVHVHKAVQKWIENGNSESVHSGVRWLTETFAHNLQNGSAAHSEVLVTDFNQYASAVDIVQEMPDGALLIYDIKKGRFRRDYVTWQLSVYRYFIQKYAERSVGGCVCICLRDREYYDVFPKSHEQVEKLLYG